MKNHDNGSGFDDFWEIDALIPVRKVKPAKHPPRHIETTEITAPPLTGTSSPTQDEKLTLTDRARSVSIPIPRSTPKSNYPHNDIENNVICDKSTTIREEESPLTEHPVFRYHDFAPEPPKPLFSYRPTGGLVHEVRIYPWKNQYTYYEQFARFAVRYAEAEGTPSPEVDFFSYMPQYAQMSRAQLAYYLWWRTNFRKGICLHASYAYLLLFLYEIINISDHINPKTGQEMMLRLWLSYREKHPRLDVLIREWLCDYSLLHRLPPPRLPVDKFRELVSGAQLKEFYVSATEGDAHFTNAVLYFCSNYDYRKSKFYTEESAPLFHRILRGAAEVALRHQQEKMGENATHRRGYSTVGRDAFSGAICSYRLKRHIEVDFSSFAHTHELRFVITDVLKYAENALRAWLGVKSRLTVYEVGNELRLLLDAYLKEALPPRERKKTAATTEALPDYERRYEPEARPLSLENAVLIEQNSWKTTQRLVEAFESETGTDIIKNHTPSVDFIQDSAFSHPVVKPSEEEKDAKAETALAVENTSVSFFAALGNLAKFLPLAKAQDRAAQRAFARSVGQMLDAVADRINTIAETLLGDVVLEDVGGCYGIIEDYLDLLENEGVL